MCDQQSLRSACAFAQSDQSLCLSLEYSMGVKLLTEHHLQFLSLKGGSTCSSESTHIKMPHCWISRHGSISMLQVVWLYVCGKCVQQLHGLFLSVDNTKCSQLNRAYQTLSGISFQSFNYMNSQYKI